MAEQIRAALADDEPSDLPTAQRQIVEEAAHEFVFAVVGRIGSGTSQVARAFKELLERQNPSFDTRILKATEVIENWAKRVSQQHPARTGARTIDDAQRWQDLGDEMRKKTKDNSAVAKGLIAEIRNARGAAVKQEVVNGEPVVPDGTPRAYILDALRHPAEVNLLRHLYQEAFVLIGVVCDQEVRLARLEKKFQSPTGASLDSFMQRDEKDNRTHGQQVAKAFQLADFYVDNTPDRFTYTETGAIRDENPLWDINDKLQRLVRIVRHDGIERPEIAETAMHHAYSAQMRSACLSRQVGAALVDREGNLLATGTNEVPKAGGGVYGEGFERDDAKPRDDHRCAFQKGEPKYCSSTREQNVIIEDIINEVSTSLGTVPPDKVAALRSKLKNGRVGDTIEFSRAVHAEMDALLSAARSGASTVGTRLFVTTYPCHYCARHIISAGVDEVQYIEPYFKSLAARLHSDAIQQSAKGWLPPSQQGQTLLFRPFTGVAPRLYRRAFLKDRDLKNDDTGDLWIGTPGWGTPWHLRKKSYVQLEAQITKTD
jgi:deoxycytidylate deaminase/dephospho-CoA kinase